MLNLEEAKAIAATAHEQFHDKYDHWYETEKAFVFAVSDYEGYGGYLMPFMVMKDDGSVNFAYSQAMMLGALGEDIADGELH